MNKYEKWYASITQNAKTRLLKGYSERHHIIPRSLGGTDNIDNLVDLTAREHFICHWLLTKTHTGQDKHKMLNALRMLRAENLNQKRYKTKITARVYANLKEEYAIIQSKKFSGINNPMYGEKFHRSEEGKKRQRESVLGENNGSKQLTAREKVRQSKLGKTRDPFDSNWKQNLSKNHKSKQPGFDGTITEETRKKIGNKIRGRKQTNEEKKRRGDSVKALGLKREKKLCPHCQQSIAINTYPRWHGENCRNLAK